MFGDGIEVSAIGVVWVLAVVDDGLAEFLLAYSEEAIMLGNCYLYLDFFIANTEFILNVLGCSKALEVTAVYHDAHLGRKALGFVD